MLSLIVCITTYCYFVLFVSVIISLVTAIGTIAESPGGEGRGIPAGSAMASCVPAAAPLAAGLLPTLSGGS